MEADVPLLHCPREFLLHPCGSERLSIEENDQKIRRGSVRRLRSAGMDSLPGKPVLVEPCVEKSWESIPECAHQLWLQRGLSARCREGRFGKAFARLGVGAFRDTVALLVASRV